MPATESAADKGEEVFLKDMHGAKDYFIRQIALPSGNGAKATTWGVVTRYNDVVMTISQPHFILSQEWEIGVKQMNFQDACTYSATHRIPCKRAGSSARIEVDWGGELWYSSISPAGCIVKTLHHKDITANDWIPV